jgi:solute carrier family 25 protein 16
VREQRIISATCTPRNTVMASRKRPRSDAEPTSTKRSWHHVLYGGVAGCVAKTAVAPIERARLMAQTGAFEGTFRQTLITIFKKEGFIGLWRGNGANCMRVFPQKGLLFATNDFFKDGFRSFFGTHSIFISCLSGAAAGMTASAATFPLDVTRMRMSATKVAHADDARRSFKAVFHEIFRNEGLRGLYRGIRPTVIGAVPYEGIKFGCFDAFRSLWVSTMNNNNNYETEELLIIPLYGKLICGACSGIVAGGFMYPNDTIRRRMQVAGAMGGGVEDRLFTGPLDCARDTYKRGGIRRFYRGVTPYLVRMVPNAAIQFWVYETCKEWATSYG